MKKKVLWALGGLFAGFALMGSGHDAKAVGRVEIEVGRFAIEKGVFNTIFAKELCSCQFVDGLTLEECQARDNLPPISHHLVEITTDPDAHTVTSKYRGEQTIMETARSLGFNFVTVGGPATAKFDAEHPEFGCVLTKLPWEPATPALPNGGEGGGEAGEGDGTDR